MARTKRIDVPNFLDLSQNLKSFCSHGGFEFIAMEHNQALVLVHLSVTNGITKREHDYENHVIIRQENETIDFCVMSSWRYLTPEDLDSGICQMFLCRNSKSKFGFWALEETPSINHPQAQRFICRYRQSQSGLDHELFVLICRGLITEVGTIDSVAAAVNG